MSGKGLLKSWKKLGVRTRWLIGAVASVVVLAIVIYGIAALSSPSDSSTRRSLTPIEQSQDYYDKALAQEAQGNFDEALDLAKRAAKADPTNTKASQLVVRLEDARRRATNTQDPPSSAGGGTNAGGSGSTTDPSTSPPAVVDPVFNGPVEDIRVFIPVKIEGWVLGPAVAVGPDGTVACEPVPTAQDLRSVSGALLAVHDRGSAAKAKSFVDTTMKRVYSRNGTTIVVAGAPGYFGTDGARLAGLAFSRGRYAFEIVLTTLDGNPLKYKDATLKLASTFPTSL